MKCRLKVVLAAMALIFSLGVEAGELPYDKAAFEKTLAEGKPVIVDFYADWCPTCKTQKPIVQELMRDPKMKEVTCSTGQTRKAELAAIFANAI